LKKDVGGNGVLERIAEDLPPSMRTLLTDRLVASAWYSLEGADEMMTAVAAHLGRDPVEYARRLGHSVAFESAGPIGRTMMRLFGNPERIASYLPKMWTQLYDSGVVRGVYDPVDGILTIRVAGWMGHTPLGCFNPLGSIEELSRRFEKPPLIEAEQAECVSRGASMCRWVLRYDVR